MARVPSPNVGTSNTPSGPFQTIVLRRLQRLLEGLACCGPMSTTDQQLGILWTGTILCSAPRVTSLATTTSVGSRNCDALLLGGLEDALARPRRGPLEQALAHRVALGDEEGVGHAAADDERVDLVHQVLEHLDLARHLGAADDRRERVLGRLEQAATGCAISRSMSRPA